MRIVPRTLTVLVVATFALLGCTAEGESETSPQRLEVRSELEEADPTR